MRDCLVVISLFAFLLLSVLCVKGDHYIGGCYRKRLGCFNEPCKRRCRLLYGLDGHCQRTKLCHKRQYRCNCKYQVPENDQDD